VDKQATVRITTLISVKVQKWHETPDLEMKTTFTPWISRIGKSNIVFVIAPRGEMA
jgi:hypothetical protein